MFGNHEGEWPDGQRIPQPVWLVMFLVDIVLSAGLAFYGHAVYENSEDNLRLTCTNSAFIQKRVPPDCESKVDVKFLERNNITIQKEK